MSFGAIQLNLLARVYELKGTLQISNLTIIFQMKEMSLREVKISITEFKYVRMLEKEPRVIILCSLLEK